jgi:hypothetical protein
MGILLGLLVYVAPLYGAIPRPGPGGAIDRTLGIVLARHRQAEIDAAAEDPRAPRLGLPALPPVSPPHAVPPEAARGSIRGAGRSDLASRPPSPGRPRSPPAA